MSRLMQLQQQRAQAMADSPASSPSQKDSQPDQKKVYMDWANHYLRKAHYTQTLTDLHECVQGDNLPKIIHAVVQSHVPNVTVSPATEEERAHNIEYCVRHLEETGINCSAFSVADLADGNTKAILSLFYTLSQFKRTSKSATGSEGHTSRIARPISPGIKSTYGIVSGGSSQGLTNGTSGGGVSKMVPPATNRRTAGSSIATSTIDKSFGARRATPYKNVILNGEKPAALDTNGDSEGGVKIPGGLSAIGSTSRLSGIPGVKPSPGATSSQIQHTSPTSVSQPNLNHHPPSRSRSEPKLVHQVRQQYRKESTASVDIETESGGKSPAAAGTATSSLPKRMLKHPSASNVQSGRCTPVERGGGGGVSSGRTTPSRLTRPASRLNRFGENKKTVDSAREGSSDEGESDKTKNRMRSNSEVKRVSVTTPIRSASRTGGKELPGATGSSIPSNFAGRGLQKSAIHGSDSRLVSPSSVLPGDLSAGLRKGSLPLEKERSLSSSEPGTVLGGGGASKKPTTNVQASLQRLQRGQGSSSIPTNSVRKEEGEKSEGVRGEEGESESEKVAASSSSKLSKPSSLPRFGAMSPGDRRKSPSGLSRFPQPLSTSQGFTPTPRPQGSKVASQLESRGSKIVPRTRESDSSLEGSSEEMRPVKLDKQVSSTSSTGSTGSSSSTAVSEGSKPEEGSKLVAPLPAVGGGGGEGKDNRRISPEGMSPDRKTLSNESLGGENRKNSLNKVTTATTTKLIEEVAGESDKVAALNGTGTGKVGGVSDLETQTPNLSQGSEVTTESTLSSLSLASVSSPPPSQPETGQALYSITASPLTKHTSSQPSQNSHADTSDVTGIAAGNNPRDQGSPRRFTPMRSPLAKEKEKAKRARSLSPKSSRRIFPTQPTVVGPSVNVSHYDTPVLFSPPHGGAERFTHLELTRVDSPESTKSDIGVASAYSSARKPLRSSLRTAKETKDSSSSSVDSGKVHLHPNKVTISPRSSQVVFLPDEAGLQHSAAFSQPTILSPAKRTRGRPSSLSDNTSVDKDQGKRESTTSEKMDYSTVEMFLSPSLGQNSSHQRYDSTPELLLTFENELSTMKKDLANKDRMLSMYENSMADLSSKVHHLKKTLEEKDQEIKHLTETKLFDLDGRSLVSRMSHAATEVLSDGCLSDSAMEPGHHGHKDEKKKKKWKRWSFRRKAKDTSILGSSLDTESVISGKSGRSYSVMRRQPSKSKTDLMSISEYSPERRMRDMDAKSFTSEFVPAVPYNNDDVITVFDDPSPGAKAPVTLLPGYSSYMSGYGRGADDEMEGTVVLGTISIAPEISWITMDSKICDIFMHHINTLDGEGNLSLNEDSILHYFIADQRREIGNALLPPLTPYQSLATGTTVRIVLRGALQGSCDSLAYKILISTETLQSYISLLMETQWLVVMGTKGTCKTSLAQGLSRHLMQIVGDEEDEEEGGNDVVVINYNVERDGLEKMLVDMKEDLSRKIRMWPHPPIIVADNIYECSVLEQILSVAANLPRRPYIIATLCTATMQGVPLHQLLFHHKVRVVTCNPQMEPVFGILSRSLRKQVYKLKAARIEVDSVAERLLQWLPYLLEHLDGFINRFHTQTVSLGPRVFLDCALDQNRNELETWFISLWNHFVIPYLMGATMAGIETYTADPHLEWVDVREFVVETYPWQPSINVMKLRTLNPEDVGWNHAVRPQQNRFLLFKDDMKIPDDARSIVSRVKVE